MAWYPYSKGESERLRHLREQSKRIFEQRINYSVQRTQNPPSLDAINDDVLGQDLIAVVHEELALNQMKKHYRDFIEQGDTSAAQLFWTNQRRFLEFIGEGSPRENFDKAKSGYKWGHAWFLHNNPKYASRFKSMTAQDLAEYRKANWAEYNGMVMDMHNHAPKYDSIDKVILA